MLQSTHYELKLVEGTDIVNPLVIDRPNYESIDDVMYENESKSIGTATELKSGTIHAITRAKGNQRFFCFTATSNYSVGDTFTVDSVPVTALLPNGTALPDNAYVVNGTVLCSLIGTLLTVYTIGSSIADDSLKLGGELPSYYATASDLDDVRTTANAASTLSASNYDDLVVIKNDLTVKIGSLILPEGQFSAVTWNQIRKYGKILTIELKAQLANPLNGSAGVIGVIPADFGISDAYPIEIRGSYGSAGYDQYEGQIQSTGNIITATGGSTFSGSFRLDFTLVLK